MTLRQETRLHSAFHHKTLQKWQCTQSVFDEQTFMYPVFITDADDGVEEIASMPGVFRYGVKKILHHLTPLVKIGLSSILIFGVPHCVKKDSRGSGADEASVVVRVLKLLKKELPQLLLACDVCLCPYTDHGHCGILRPDGSIDNEASIKRLAELALSYAVAGCDVIAPSDMMDGRVGMIKNMLLRYDGGRLANKVAVLSYSAKFASAFYGPFRDAAKSLPSFGDRCKYQLPPGSSSLALRAVARDVEEGADMLMVKPGVAYLDIVKLIKQQFPNHPVALYQVSGEYAMIWHAAEKGALDLNAVLCETFASMKRTGADVIISYFTPHILRLLHKQRTSSKL